MFNLSIATRAPGSYADLNLVGGLATDLDPSLAGVEAETRQHRRPSHLVRGHTTASRFSRFTAPVQNLATRTVVVAGTTAALSPVAMAADPAASGLGMEHLL